MEQVDRHRRGTVGKAVSTAQEVVSFRHVGAESVASATPATAHTQEYGLRPAIHDAAHGEMAAIGRPLDALDGFIGEFHVACGRIGHFRGTAQVDGPPVPAGTEGSGRRSRFAGLRRIVLHRSGQTVPAQFDAESAAERDGEEVARTRIRHTALPDALRRHGDVPEERVLVHGHIVPDPAEDGAGALAGIAIAPEGGLEVRRDVLQEPSLVR